MNFSDALHYAKAGRRIRRPTFSTGACVFAHTTVTGVGDYLAFQHPDFPLESWHPSQGDILATDWQIVRDPALSGAAVDQAGGVGVTGAPEFEPLSQINKDDPRAYTRPDFDLDKARLDSITGGRFAKERAEAQEAATKARMTAPPAVEVLHAFEDLRDKLSRIFSPSVIHPAGLENLEVRLQEAEFWAQRCAEQIRAGVYVGSPIDAADRLYEAHAREVDLLRGLR